MKQPDLDHAVSDTLIDRLIDGGMTPEELRVAVEQLERDPGGWKRCALAFVEAQVLNESFRALGNAEQHDPNAEFRLLHLASAKRAGFGWLRKAAAAAAIVVASFAIGWAAHGTRTAAPAEPRLALGPAAMPVPKEPVSDLAVFESPPRQSSAPVADQSVAPDDSMRAVRAVATIQFGPESSHAEVPVLAGPGITEEWLAQQPPPVSEHGQIVLARQGYQVEQQRRFYTTVLADGRRVAVPVDHVQIHYTGNEPL